MNRWSGKVAVVTGASSGIGLAITKTLLKNGMVVIGLARRKSQMERELKEFDGNFHAYECDISEEKQINDAFAWIKLHFKTIHVFINNAGILKLGRVADTAFNELKKVIDVNFTGLLLCSKHVIDIMKEGGHESHIIMINSICGHRINPTPSPHCTNVYSATKYAVRALATTLEKEQHGENIRITNLSPGAVKSELLENMSKEIPIIAQLNALEAEDIADAVVYVLGAPSRVLIEELIIKPTNAPY